VQVTDRDRQLLKDLALSHVLSRDQILALSYFETITRVNTRLRGLIGERLVRRLDTPFFTQSLYRIGPAAGEILGGRIGRIVAGRSDSPRFLQHALMLTNTRIALLGKGATGWRFEQQIRCTFECLGRSLEVRPDGLAIMAAGALAVEVDLGHVAPAKFAAKLAAFDAFIASGACQRLWQMPSFKVLTVTTSRQRAASLARLAPKGAHYELRCASFAELGISFIGGWS
jgi:hypothetical protein